MLKGMCQICGVKEDLKDVTWRFSSRCGVKGEEHTWEYCPKCLAETEADKCIEITKGV